MIFKGMLAFFLDMGVATAKRLTDLRNVPKRLAFYGVLAPITHASIALLLSWAGVVGCQCHASGGASWVGVIHSGPSSVEARPARIKPESVPWPFTRTHISVQYNCRYTTLLLGG